MSLAIALLGNPNSGKTTLFNALTGAQQRVGNWPGVTVERKSGFFQHQGQAIEVIDLPGVYSLSSSSESLSLDERIACEFILKRDADIIVNILDAANLERNLYLTMQLIEMRIPVIVVVNMVDVAQQRKIHISLDLLAKILGCPVVAMEANKKKGLEELKQLIGGMEKQPSQIELPYPAAISQAIEELVSLSCKKCPQVGDKQHEHEHWLAVRLLEDDVFAEGLVCDDMSSRATVLKKQISLTLDEDVDILLADARYRFIQGIMQQCVKKSSADVRTATSYIDAVLLNRVLGIPIFLCVMYGIFLFAINIGGAFQDFFDISSRTLFVEGVAHVLQGWHAPDWLVALLANGVGKGINTTITFIPVIGAMFLALAFLEDSGYMARAAFIIDRLMRALGLPGKSFVPMIVGFGCNVPSVMAARTLENKRDRILTVMMSPFMSCGARLAIYAVFTAAFFPVGGATIVFALYLIGIGMAMLTGLLLRKTLLRGDPAPLVMELPPYHLPRLTTLGLLAWQRLKSFVFRAGKLIVPICVVIGALNVLNTDGTLNTGEGDVSSLLSSLGHALTPIFSPMGIQQDNWPATVGLVTGVLAKEVVVGTLNSLYSQIGHLATMPGEAFHFWGNLYEALASIPKNLSEIGNSLGNPVLAKAPVQELSQSVYGLMVDRFDGRIGAMAYLLFVLLYFPCVSTTAAMLRELNRGWTVFSMLWTTGVAYGVAVGFYQIATYARHPFTSFLWIAGIVIVFSAVILTMRIMSGSSVKKGGRYELARN